MFTITSTETAGALVAVISGSAFIGGLYADWRRRRKYEVPAPRPLPPNPMAYMLAAAEVPAQAVAYADGVFAAGLTRAEAEAEADAEADAFIAELHGTAPEAAPEPARAALERGWYARLTTEQEAFMAAHLDDVDAVDDWLARGCPGPGRPAPWLPVSAAWEALELEPA